jgi:phosphoglycolate phosphatase-like HAD superfamily hydrolase
MKYLILFDIDGTILEFRHGIAKELFSQLLEELLGEKVPDSAIPQFHGMTDLDIIRQITKNIGVSFENTMHILPKIWAKMIEMFQLHSVPENVTMLPGIIELINKLHSNENVCLGLVTGNFQENAYLKLKVAGLDNYFPIGAFGCDAINRNDLPPLAIKRANSYFSTNQFNSSNTVIIGDTYRDIECAKTNDIKVIAVATGGFSIEELEAYNPDVTVSDFSNVTNSLNIIYSLLNIN